MFYPLKADLTANGSFGPMIKESGMLKNPDTEVANAAAFRIIFIYTIATAFNLSEEETLWIGYQLDSILSPLLKQKPDTVPFPVRQEMLKETYTFMLEQRTRMNKLTDKPEMFNNNVLQADLNEWVETLMSVLNTSYNLPPIVEIKIKSELAEMLASLGVGAVKAPRMSTHLPKDLLENVFSERKRH